MEIMIMDKYGESYGNLGGVRFFTRSGEELIISTMYWYGITQALLAKVWSEASYRDLPVFIREMNENRGWCDCDAEDTLIEDQEATSITQCLRALEPTDFNIQEATLTPEEYLECRNDICNFLVTSLNEGELYVEEL